MSVDQIAQLAGEANIDSLPPQALWGIPVALIGAAFLSFGAQFQSRGLNKVEHITGQSASQGLSVRHTLNLFLRPSWVVGTVLLGLATLLQIISLGLSPIMLVQPIGVVALVITAVLNMHYSQIRLGAKALFSIAMCVAGVGVFVAVAAVSAVSTEVTDTKLRMVLVLFAVVFFILLALYIAMRKHAVALMYILGTGVLYGFVATLAKTVISRIQQEDFDAYLWVSIIALVLGAILGMYFVQNAYASGPPDLVIAGLTVVDPLIAVLIGIAVLGEAATASMTAVVLLTVAGGIAALGVVGLARYHPQTGSTSLLRTSTGSIALPRQEL